MFILRYRNVAEVLLSIGSNLQLIQKYGDDLAVMIDEGLPGDLKPYLAGINFCGLLTMLTSPSVLQFMYSLAKEEWMCLNPDLKTVSNMPIGLPRYRGCLLFTQIHCTLVLVILWRCREWQFVCILFEISNLFEIFCVM